MDKSNGRPQHSDTSDVQILRKNLVWDGFVKFYVTEIKVKTSKNEYQTLSREVHDHGNAATVLPIDLSRKTALLVSQWRIPALLNGHQDRLWEIVAGIVDPGESSEDCARRETLEETGYEITELEPICEAFSSPGTLTERFSLYFGYYTQESKKSDTHGLEHEGEDIILGEFSFEDLFEMGRNGQIVDAKTLLAIWALERKIKT